MGANYQKKTYDGSQAWTNADFCLSFAESGIAAGWALQEVLKNSFVIGKEERVEGRVRYDPFKSMGPIFSIRFLQVVVLGCPGKVYYL